MRIVVIGDVMLDVWTEGVVDRISPEAPVPILASRHTRHSPGGAANVALNLRRLGVGEVCLLSTFVGDEDGHLLQLMLKDAGVTCFHIKGEQYKTTRKHRFTCGGVQLLRVDDEATVPSPEYDVEHILSMVRGVEAVIVSDYNKGVVTKKLCEILEDCGTEYYVDPKQSADTYPGAYLIKPNAKEFLKLSWEGCEVPVLTTSGEGPALYYEHGVMHSPKLRIEPEVVAVSDVTGAGDAVLAALVVAECEGYSREEAIKLGIKAGTLCVQKHGAEGPTREELGLQEQFVSQKVVFTNGCFDLFHDGHKALLDGAVSEVVNLHAEGYRNTCLLVAVNSDASVSKLKGVGRPRVMLADRIAAISEYLTKRHPRLAFSMQSFPADTPLELIKRVKPDVIVKGDEYRTGRVVGELEALEWGGQVKFAPMLPGVSTTQIIKELGA